jgi:hypothetical protein
LPERVCFVLIKHRVSPLNFNSSNRWRASEQGRRYSGADLMSNGNEFANSVGDFAFRRRCMFTPSKDILVCGGGVLRCSMSGYGAGRSQMFKRESI